MLRFLALVIPGFSITVVVDERMMGAPGEQFPLGNSPDRPQKSATSKGALRV
jgi:hypothetical protein